MDEDRLSPDLGRLIDTAKAAARAAASAGRPEAVALLTAGGTIYSGGNDEALAGQDRARTCSAARDAVGFWKDGGEEAILAAALAWADATAEDALPCRSCREALAALDPHLPLVLKRRGRWVVVALSSLPAERVTDA